MRLWSIHPCYLDSAGLVALWRETLLARKVLQGKTRGYRHHPQLNRFRSTPQPINTVNRYLKAVYDESVKRGFSFDRSKLGRTLRGRHVPVNSGQARFEFEHLMRKLLKRSPERHGLFSRVRTPRLHPLFRRVRGPVEEWERP